MKSKKEAGIPHDIPLLITILVLASGIALLYMNFIAEQPKTIFEITYREDYAVLFSSEVLEKLKTNYKHQGPENFFCMIGSLKEKTIVVNELRSEEIIFHDSESIVYKHDPPCQMPEAVGSIHSHPEQSGCEPSTNDLFTFGEMKNPEPIINAIQCGIEEIYILKMPGKQERLDSRSIRWSIS